MQSHIASVSARENCCKCEHVRWICSIARLPSTTRKNGKPVLDFRGSWYSLCQKSGLGQLTKTDEGREKWEGLIFHDLRRSAVRNMVRRGVPERVSMAISGHKTRAVFDRYDIVSESNLIEAARKIEEGREIEVGHSFGHSEEPSRVINRAQPPV